MTPLAPRIAPPAPKLLGSLRDVRALLRETQGPRRIRSLSRRERSRPLRRAGTQFPERASCSAARRGRPGDGNAPLADGPTPFLAVAARFAAGASGVVML